MEADETEGELVTRPIRFSGAHLFINAAAANGTVRAEILDRAGKPIAPFTRANCVAAASDSTHTQLSWKGSEDLSTLAGKEVRVRFLVRNASLFSFWVSATTEGHSRGYVAAGGPGFRGPVDSPSGF
jgi:hypothetical protein